MLSQKTALITGSTSGIGAGVAEMLAQKGANIVLNGFGEADAIAAFQAKLEAQYKIRVTYDPANLAEPNAIETMMQNIEARFGAVDILVNNAGIQHVDAIENFPPERWDSVIAINLSSAFHTIRLSVAGMKKRGFGRIINIASAHGLVASANKTAYVASKHGIIGLTKAVALETATTGVTCNAICPGWVLTPLVQKQIDAIAAREKISVQEAELQLLSEKQPSKRFSTPEQIGALAVFLCGPEAGNVTGASWSMDGGWTAQ